MKKLRDLILLLLVVTGFAISLEMIRRAVGITSPWFGLTVMLYVTGMIAVARPVFLLPLPRFLREARDWEKNGRLYDALGVPAFGALLRNTPLRYLNTTVYLTRHPGGIAEVLKQIEAAEGAHYLAAVALIPWMVCAVVHGWWGATAAMMAVQVSYNVYPALHLRSVRVRLARLQEKKRSRKRV